MNPSLRPRVSVVITTFNKAATLKHAIESVLWQSFQNFELWIIGDGCTDHSEDVVQSFCDPRILWFNLPLTCSNHFKLLGEGLKRCRGEYIAYIGETDIWLRNHLQLLIDELDVSESDVAFSITQSVHTATYSTVNIPVLPDMPVPPEYSSIVHKKNLFDSAGNILRLDAANSRDFFRLSKSQGLSMQFVSVTTGLKFLCENAISDTVAIQLLYLERLKRDPDFINKELSAILSRTGNSHPSADMSNAVMHWLSRPLVRMFKRFIIDQGAGSNLRIIRNDELPDAVADSSQGSFNGSNTPLITKRAKAV